MIIFKTILDNIKSFFQKEEELLKEPKQVPDAASEVLGDSPISDSGPIVNKKLPGDTSPKPSSPKQELPFSASELQQAFQKQQTPQAQERPAQISQPIITQREIHELESEYVSDDDLMAFEETMNQLPVQETRNHRESFHEPSRYAQKEKTLSRDGFFSSFQDFIEQGDLDPSHLDGDLLHKMRSFHQRRTEGKEPLLHKQSTTDLLRRRLSELQVLEHEWERLYAESRDAERAMIHLEEEIDEKTRALRTLMSESQHLTLLSREVPVEQAFVLANGIQARSLGALLRAVRKEPWLFERHVSTERNDFAMWTEHILEQKSLATTITHASSVDELLQLLHA